MVYVGLGSGTENSRFHIFPVNPDNTVRCNLLASIDPTRYGSSMVYVGFGLGYGLGFNPI